MQWILQDINFGNNIQRIRKERRLTQSQVAVKMHLLGSTMSRSTYSKIESGERNIKVSDLIFLKMVFDVDYSEFFNGLMDVL